jgi:hypothetical protein
VLQLPLLPLFTALRNCGTQRHREDWGLSDAGALAFYPGRLKYRLFFG